MSNKKLPPFEDIVNLYLNYTLNKLFPKRCNNKWFVYILGFFHLLGTIVLSYGILLPNNILPLYVIYCLVNIFLYYFVFDTRCFMTLLTNYYGNVKGTALQIRMNTAFYGLGLNLLLAIIGIVAPNYSVYSLLSSYFK